MYNELDLDLLKQLIKAQVPLAYALAYFGLTYNQMQDRLGLDDLGLFYENTKKAGLAELMLKRYEFALKKGNPILLNSLAEQYIKDLESETKEPTLFQIQII